MARTKTVHRCTSCSALAPRWTGRCGSCGEWNTLVEELEARGSEATGLFPGSAGLKPIPLNRAAEAEPTGSAAVPTGLAELDRVLSGGLLPGSVTLIGGEPGIGKSTLVLQALASIAASGTRALLVSAEESLAQVSVRARRLGADLPELWMASEACLPSILAGIAEVEPTLVALDSIQAVHDPDVSGSPGTAVQVRESAAQLVSLAKGKGIAVVMVGHVTKDGSLAGPRVLEHAVDTVLSFEGERHHALRLLRALKHRFGPTGELGLFEMSEKGLASVPDASGLFLGDRRAGTPGTIVLAALEGQRALLVEVQALTASTTAAMPRRSAQGLDGGRLALLLAVLESRAGVRLGDQEVFASVVGGVRVSEPAADLAVGLALASAKAQMPLPPDLVACGEVGLGGEVRMVCQTSRRLSEAARLGFTKAAVPPSSPEGPRGMEVVRVVSLSEAVDRFLGG